ncbi:murein L,D-transpeptidase catalytic domain family protein [Pseudoxanthomonas putridarboris]|uniref:Murein L,D-transpeptidase catalytic domain family protein n=1 Tax=Pseudoxanthomonas putridarboris TaxID=752605 RepID=A0ABU9J0P4_9GAMM
MTRSRWFSLLPALLVALPAAGSAEPPQANPPEGIVDALHRAAPALDRKVLSMAARAMSCSLKRGDAVPMRRLSVIDYSRPSTQPRMWVFDLERQRLLFEEWVAHGRNTGENLATRFSNATGSYMSSLGAFQTEESYQGANGYSLRLRGLEPGFNDKARERAIVIHGAPYVSNDLIRSQGRLGRSLGCPAVRTAVARPLIDTIRGGSFVFAYYPDPDWLRSSRLLSADCGTGAAASGHATAHAGGR